MYIPSNVYKEMRPPFPQVFSSAMRTAQRSFDMERESQCNENRSSERRASGHNQRHCRFRLYKIHELLSDRWKP
jgi:hypothetical protein